VQWHNWAGDERCRPAKIEQPSSLQELSSAIARAGDGGLRVRAERSTGNRLRLELTVPHDQQWNAHTRQGYEDLRKWVETKERAKREGRDPAKALLEMIRDAKRRYASRA
jgi:hypothetical protein